MDSWHSGIRRITSFQDEFEGKTNIKTGNDNLYTHPTSYDKSHKYQKRGTSHYPVI